MAQVFQNFMHAQAEAGMAATTFVKAGGECLAFYFIRERQAGNPLTEQEMDQARAMYDQALRDKYRQVLTGWIMAGRVRDCRQVRYFMAHNQ